MRVRSSPSRRGLSLLEVIVSLAIFLLSYLAIWDIVMSASERAFQVQELSRAMDLAQSKMAEVSIGAVPLQSQQDSPFDDDPDFTWSMTAAQGQANGLWNVTVTVQKPNSNNNIKATLAQFLLDPTIVGSTQDSSVVAGTDNSSASPSSSSSSSTTPTPSTSSTTGK